MVGEETVAPLRMGTPNDCIIRTIADCGVLPMLNRSNTRECTVVADGRMAGNSLISFCPVWVSDQFCILIGNGRFVFAARMEVIILSVTSADTACGGKFMWIHRLIRWRYSYLILRTPMMRSCCTRMAGVNDDLRLFHASSSLLFSPGWSFVA